MDNDTQGAIDHLAQMSHALRTAVYHGEQAVEYLDDDTLARTGLHSMVESIAARARQIQCQTDRLREEIGDGAVPALREDATPDC